jgi:hypothetical protein
MNEYCWQPESDRMSLTFGGEEWGYIVRIEDGCWLAVRTLGIASITRCTSSTQARTSLLALMGIALPSSVGASG